MRLFFYAVLFSLAASFSAFSAPPVPSGNIVSLTVGGRVFTDLTNLKILVGFVNSTNNTTPRAPSASAGYQVTAGKTLDILAASCNIFSAGTATFQMGYADNDVGIGTATAKTNGVYMTGDSTNGSFANNSVVGVQQSAIKFSVPATKYPFIESNAAGGGICTLYGYER
jgi:hypothetical protein